MIVATVFLGVPCSFSNLPGQPSQNRTLSCRHRHSSPPGPEPMLSFPPISFSETSLLTSLPYASLLWLPHYALGSPNPFPCSTHLQSFMQPCLWMLRSWRVPCVSSSEHEHRVVFLSAKFLGPTTFAGNSLVLVGLFQPSKFFLQRSSSCLCATRRPSCFFFLF